MAAAATSDLFPTTALAALSSDAAALSNALATTEFGCPESDFLSLGLDCLQTTNIPSCLAPITDFEATATVDYNAACCTSISKWGLSIESCLVKSAPSCLDTSALLASATAPGGAYATESNPCAPYWGGGKGSGPTQTPGPSSKAGTAAGGNAAGGTAAGETATAGTATATSSGGSTASAKAANAAIKTGASLKVYLGLGLVGALAVLMM